MLIFPAIDLRDGQVVRLQQGDYDRMTVYSSDPVETAKGFVYAGAACLHVVDLDGARDGSPKNREAIQALCKLPLDIEVGGGIRDERTIKEYLKMGVKRVILGSIAVEDFAFTERMGKRYGDRLAAGVDVKNGKVAIHGWTNVSDLEGFAFCQQLRDAGISTVIYTDISKDGLLQGTNLEAYKQLQAIKGLNVIASGGISFEEELIALRDLNGYGAIIGKALYDGKLSLKRALDIAKGEN
ncbi:MAG TPA: 1-(5-phosphoribosyl)-5-[(5-phosphoribosylamino)methylideneamino]imidazole-4-carboxamide isomerase [Candidatus Limiplasma sp.]|nr:1-(5-phosphoribosyl)-5-[(5-phosphoribosylamino)methylideneamino]imidazole-4-carboxamide isomerase [Candidatus Limiplasma sp.]